MKDKEVSGQGESMVACHCLSLKDDDGLTITDTVSSSVYHFFILTNRQAITKNFQ